LLPPHQHGYLGHRLVHHLENGDLGGRLSGTAAGELVNSRINRIPSLDGVRGLAVLGVMASHLPTAGAAGRDRLLARLSMPGQTGVDLFFVLSGFLITGILLDSKAAAHPLRTFYFRRLVRIFPLYYVTLLLLFIVLPTLLQTPRPPAGDQLWFWLYLQNIGFALFQTPGPNHLWSLAVEEQFYLLWPVIVLHAERRTILRCLVAAVAIALLSRIVLIAVGHKSFYFTLCRLDGLALGGLLAMYSRSPQGLTPLYAPARHLLILGLVPLAAVYVVFSGSNLLVLQVTKSTLVSCLYAAFLVTVLAGGAGSLPVRICSIGALRSVGKYSYALYLFHPFVFAAVGAAPLSIGLPLRWLVGFGATYAMALVSWHCLERPFLTLKDRFAYTSSPPSAVPVSI
jgi:peptidoglycan/LPS O-acetylase OafA/YrhL